MNKPMIYFRMPKYKRVFAPGHSYFITIVTHQRKPILIDNIQLLRQAFADSKKHYDYTILAIVILPDHLHMIIEPDNSDEYPKIVSYIKRKFTYLMHQNGFRTNIDKLSASKTKKRESDIWQRRYYEHTIRNEKDFELHLDYIHYNPVKRNLSTSASKWKYGSFSRYVKMGWYDREWCDFSDNYSFGE